MYGSWLYCSKNIHCRACARANRSPGRKREPAAVVELEHRDAAVRVDREELRRARLAREDLLLDQREANAELGEQQSHLVAVPRGQEVVEPHRGRRVLRRGARLNRASAIVERTTGECR